jgi:arginine-tRNA-protein transferase
MSEHFKLHQLPTIKGEVLDIYLENGWYRYGNKIFTIQSFTEHEQTYEVFWLRYHASKIQYSLSTQKLIKKNKQFQFVVKRYELTEEMEALHYKYYNGVDFQTSETIFELLQDDGNNVYETYVIEIRDKDKLISVGLFDIGSNSIAGIKNYFDPAYKKYSLGKYTMLIKHQFCVQNNISWYYPGYFAPGYKRFDYKLFLDKQATEVYIPTYKIWIPFQQFSQQIGL